MSWMKFSEIFGKYQEAISVSASDIPHNVKTIMNRVCNVNLVSSAQFKQSTRQLIGKLNVQRSESNHSDAFS